MNKLIILLLSISLFSFTFCNKKKSTSDTDIIKKYDKRIENINENNALEEADKLLKELN